MFGVPSTSPNSSIFFPLVSSNITSQFLSSSSIAPQLTAPTISSNLLLPPPGYSEAFLQQNIVNALSIPMVMSPDIARLAADTNAVTLAENEELDQPLDLSVKRSASNSLTSDDPSTSAIARPSVIRNGYANATPTRTVEVKRSASSVSYKNTSEPDVSDHFKRSLSGKWPRRSTSYAHYTPPSLSSQSPTNLKPNQTSTNNSVNGGNIDQRSLSPKSIKRLPHGATRSNSLKYEDHFRKALGNPPRYALIVENDNVEDHFRKALGEAKYERLKKAQESSSSSCTSNSYDNK